MMLKKPAFILDIQACTGCKTCMIACKDKNNLLLGVRWRRVVEFTGGEWYRMPDGTYRNDVFAYYISVSCSHCQNPICVHSCPSGAMNQDSSGIVSVDQKKCIGCRFCEWCCPYSAPQFNEAMSVMTKCDFCRDQLEKEDIPVCVAACPTRALQFAWQENLKNKQDFLTELSPLPPTELTGPNLVVTPPQNAKNVKSINGSIANKEEIRDE